MARTPPSRAVHQDAPFEVHPAMKRAHSELSEESDEDMLAIPKHLVFARMRADPDYSRYSDAALSAMIDDLRESARVAVSTPAALKSSEIQRRRRRIAMATRIASRESMAVQALTGEEGDPVVLTPDEVMAEDVDTIGTKSLEFFRSLFVTLGAGGVRPHHALEAAMAFRLLLRSRGAGDITTAAYGFLRIAAEIGGTPHPGEIFDQIVSYLTSDMVIPCAGEDQPADYTIADTLDALALGRTRAEWPPWIRFTASLLFRFGAIGAVLFAGTRLLPEVVGDWVRDVMHRFDGPLVSQLVRAAKDLFERCARAVREGTLRALFTVDPKEPAALIARAEEMAVSDLASMDVSELPSEGLDFYRSRRAVYLAMRAELLSLARRSPEYRVSSLNAIRSISCRISDVNGMLAKYEDKMPALAFLLNSAPRVGKTIVTRALHVAVATAWGKSSDPATMYSPAPNQEHFDDYEPSMSWAVLLDDIASDNPNLAKAGSGAGAYIDWLNAAPRPLGAAKLEEKGKHAARAELVIGTTNVKTLNASTYGVAGGTAITGRWPYVITMVVKKEARKIVQNEHGAFVETQMLDSAKFASDGESWDFVVEFASIGAGDRADSTTYTKLATYSTVEDLCEWAAQVAIAYRKDSQEFVEQRESLYNSVIRRVREVASKEVKTARDVVFAKEAARLGKIDADVFAPELVVHPAISLDRDPLMWVPGLFFAGVFYLTTRPYGFTLIHALIYAVVYVYAVQETRRRRAIQVVPAWAQDPPAVPLSFGVRDRPHFPARRRDRVVHVHPAMLREFRGRPPLDHATKVVDSLAAGALALLAGGVALSGYGLLVALLVLLASWSVYQFRRAVEVVMTAPDSSSRVAQGVVTTANRALNWLAASSVPLSVKRWVLTRGAEVLVAFDRLASARVDRKLAVVGVVSTLFVAWWISRRPHKVKPAVNVPGASTELPRPSDEGATDPSGWESAYKAKAMAWLRERGAPWLTESSPHYRTPYDALRDRLPVAGRTTSFEDLCQLVRRNTILLVAWSGDRRLGEAMGLVIEGGWVLTCAHVVRNSTHLSVEGVGPAASLSRERHQLSHSNAHVSPTADVAVVHLAIAPRSSVLKFLPKGGDFSALPVGHRLWVCGGGRADYPDVLTTVVGAGPKRLSVLTEPPITVVRETVSSRAPLREGYSGAAAVVEAGHDYRFISCPYFGYAAGEGGGGQFELVTQDEFSMLRSRVAISRAIPVNPAIHPSACWSRSDRGRPSAVPPHPKSWLGRVGVLPFPAVFLGTEPGRISTKFRIEATPLFPRVESLLRREGALYAAPPARAGPYLTGKDEVAWLDPVEATIRGTDACLGLDDTVLLWAVEDYVRPIEIHLARHPELRVDVDCLTPHEAFFGRRESGIVGLALDKSAGPKFGGSKSDHVVLGDHGPTMTGAVLDATSARMQEIDAAVDGVVLGPGNVYWREKEELRPISDLDRVKARFFNVTDMDELAAVRANEAPLFVGMHKLPIQLSEWLIGLNAHDPVEVARVRDHLRSKGGRGLDIDHSRFDKNRFAILALYAAIALYRLALAFGYGERAAKRVFVCAYSTVFDVAHIDGIVLWMHQMMASGIFGGSELNSVVNSIILRYVYASIAVAEGLHLTRVPPFRDGVAAGLYGDDTACGVDPVKAPWFTMDRIVAAVARFGGRATSGSKDASEYELVDVDALVILKRRFKQVDGMWALALEPASILRSLGYAVRRGAVSAGERDAECVRNALREASAHGRAFYDELRDALGEFPVEQPGYFCQPRLETFEEILEMRRARTLVTWDSGALLVVPAMNVSAESTGTAPVTSESSGANLDVATTAISAAGSHTVVGGAPSPPAPLRDSEGGYDSWWGRPVLIYQASITPTTTASSLDPFTTYFTTPSVGRKASGHRLVSAKGHLLIQVASTPMHYGGMIVAWAPGLPRMATGRAMTNPCDAWQLRNVLLDYSQSPTVEMELPMILPTSSAVLDVTGTDPRAQIAMIGRLVLVPIKELDHASLATPPPVTLTIRMWLEDYEFAVPIPAYLVAPSVRKMKPKGGSAPAPMRSFTPPPGEPESNTEQSSSGLVSTGASILTGLFNSVADWPVVGSYARTASVVAQAAGTAASALGLSSPVNETPMDLMVRYPLADLSSYKRRDWVAPGGLDPVGQVSIDPATTGAGPEDQMAFRNIGRREGLIYGSAPATLEWNSTAAQETVIGIIPVTPLATDPANPTGHVSVPPCGFPALLHHQWRGTLRYRIRVWASHYHTGRLRVTWYPSAATANAAVDPTQLHSLLLDVSQSREVFFTVGWAAPTPVLATWGPTPTTTAPLTSTSYSSTPFYTGPPLANGTLVISVDSILTGLLADTGVGVTVSVCSEDMVYFTPQNGTIQSLDIIPTMGQAEQTPQETVVISLVPEAVDRDPLLATQSEMFTHWRPLLTRYWLGYALYDSATSSNTVVGYNQNTIYFPADSYQLAGGGPSGGTKYWYLTPELFVRAAYLGWRGSHRFRLATGGVSAVNYGTPQPDSTTMIMLTTAGVTQPDVIAPGVAASGIITGVFHDTTADHFPIYLSGDWSHTGLAFSDPALGEVAGINVPYRSAYSFQSESNLLLSDGTYNGPCVGVTRGFVVAATADVTQPWQPLMFTACGDDYLLVEFMATPQVYLSTALWPRLG